MKAAYALPIAAVLAACSPPSEHGMITHEVAKLSLLSYSYDDFASFVTKQLDIYQERGYCWTRATAKDNEGLSRAIAQCSMRGRLVDHHTLLDIITKHDRLLRFWVVDGTWTIQRETVAACTPAGPPRYNYGLRCHIMNPPGYLVGQSSFTSSRRKEFEARVLPVLESRIKAMYLRSGVR